ncbi:MAG: WD40 repeat domain-containing protein [Chloroflexota bacterium]|nr:WD40 repeat domain-containing protein [Chloroflexota bacterium]
MSKGRRKFISILIFALLISSLSLNSSCKVLELEIGVPTQVDDHPAVTPTPTWKVFDTFEDGVSITLPPEWETLDTSLPDINEALTMFSEKNPDLMSRSGESIEKLLETGLIFLAFDASNEAKQTEFSGSANLGMMQVGSTFTLDEVVDFVIQNLDEVSNITSDIEERQLDTGAGKSIELHYSTEYVLPDDSVIAGETYQYLYLKDGTLYILTFVASPDRIDAYLPVFMRAANELSLGSGGVSQVLPTTAPTQKPSTPIPTWTASPLKATPTSTKVAASPTLSSDPSPIPAVGDSANVKSLIHKLLGPSYTVVSLTWHPDGSVLATGDSYTIQIWDPETGYRMQAFETSPDGGAIFSLDWSPDGTRLAAANADEIIRVWDAGTGEELVLLDHHTDFVDAVAWSPDGNTIATGDDDGILYLWDASTGEIINSYDGTSTCYSINALDWSPDGNWLAWGGLDDNVWLWDLEESFITLEGHSSSVYAISWSPDGSKIASGSYDNTVRVWDISNRKEVQILTGHSDGLTSIDWSPDGSVIASASVDAKIILWNAESGEIIRTLVDHEGWVYEIEWSPDGNYLASGGEDGIGRIWGE